METLLDKSTIWPPAYELRLSKKARKVFLRISPKKGLEVVVPARQYQRLSIADLLIEKKAWIEKHLTTPQPMQAVTSLELRAINQTWQIEYQQTLSKQIRHIVRPGTNIHTLVLHGDTKDPAKIQSWLKAWLRQLAQQHLIPWLYALSVEHDLDYNKATVRAQQTLWGSCTSERNISLNYKLLFVPQDYAKHILLHELCHTKHLNHSKRFWNLLSKLDKNCLLHNKAMRAGDQYVPLFLN